MSQRPAAHIDRRHCMSRRDFLWNFGGGLGGIALASMLGNDGLLASAMPSSRTRVLHHPAKAKRVVQLYMSGAASQCDLWDYKPALEKRHGEKFDPGEPVELFPIGSRQSHEIAVRVAATWSVWEMAERAGSSVGRMR